MHLRNGGDAFSSQKLLGHSSIDMTRRYVELAQADVTAEHRPANPGDRFVRPLRRAGGRRRLQQLSGRGSSEWVAPRRSDGAPLWLPCLIRAVSASRVRPKAASDHRQLRRGTLTTWSGNGLVRLVLLGGS